MSRDAYPSAATGNALSSDSVLLSRESFNHDAPRMRYRNRPVTVAVDPISLVISECISITSAVQKHTRSPHSSVSAILGGNPNPVHLGPPSATVRGQGRGLLAPPTVTDDSGSDVFMANSRWGLRGQKGKSMQDNPVIAGFGKLRHEIATIRGK